MSKKSLSAVKAKSEELKIPYENLLSAFVIEEAVTAVCESDEAENFRLKNNSILSLEYYRRKAPTRLEYMILSEEELTVRNVIHRMSKIFQNEKKAELWWKYRVEKEDEGICVYLSAKIEELQIPVFGLFGACSTSGEALALAAMTVAAGYGDLVLAATSSHFGSAEKEFRFPLGYANQRPLSSTWTRPTLTPRTITPERFSSPRTTGVWRTCCSGRKVCGCCPTTCVPKCWNCTSSPASSSSRWSGSTTWPSGTRAGPCTRKYSSPTTTPQNAPRSSCTCLPRKNKQKGRFYGTVCIEDFRQERTHHHPPAHPDRTGLCPRRRAAV